ASLLAPLFPGIGNPSRERREGTVATSGPHSAAPPAAPSTQAPAARPSPAGSVARPTRLGR
ncbi:hypothetical protein P7K49_015353, partial [Saguinus oedipus]